MTLSVADSVDDPENEDRQIDIYPSGLIQNFIFKDNNVAEASKFKYNSWIDVNFRRDSAVSISNDTLKQKSSDSDSGSFKFTQNNYYGYPTRDVLSSISDFRNGLDTKIKTYKLGYKFERYDDFLPYDGNFKKPFDNITSRPGQKELINVLGWTYSDNIIQWGDDYVGNTLYRFMSNVERDFSDSVFHIRTLNYGQAIDGFTTEDSFGIRLDNTLTDIDITNRPAYTILEFEIDYTGPTYSFINGFYGSQPFSLYPPATGFGSPQPYNLIDPVFLPQAFGGTTYSYNDPSYNGKTSYPINHLATNAVVKTEYFYNRAQINFYFAEAIGDAEAGEEDYKYSFRNIKYTEVDMIPFFRYATESRINQSILAPLSAISPQINYSDSEFSLIDSINITETIFETAVNPVIDVSSPFSKGGTFVIDVTALTIIDQVRAIDPEDTDITSSKGSSGISVG